MSGNKFIHLHIHSDHSLLDGFGTIEEYVERAVELGMPALALTDHNTMTGIYKFMSLCHKNNIKPICGIEFNMKPLTGRVEDEKTKVSYDVTSRNLIPNGTHTHLTVLAKNETGLKNLFRLLQQSYEVEDFFDVPRISLKQLAENKEGLIILSGCPNSELNIRLRLKQVDFAKNYINKMRSIFGDDFYIEIMDFPHAINYNNTMLKRISEQLGIKGVITNDVHYLNAEDSDLQEKFMALSSGTKIDETPNIKGGMRPVLGGNQRYFKSFEEMTETFPYEEYKSFYDNTIEIYNKVENIKLSYDSHLRPKIEIPKEFSSEIEYFDYLVEKGFQKKRGNATEEVKRISREKIKEERELIYGNDFVSYFLVVQDYINWSIVNGYQVGPGRGSVGGSEIAYLLDIHNTDPIRYGLLFERFLSDGRGMIFEIEYEDGTSEEVLVNHSFIVNGEEKYTWQLNVGDVLEGE